MKYRLFTSPEVPDRTWEIIALGVAVFFLILIGWDVISLFSVGQLSAAYRDASVLAAFPVAFPLIGFFLLRYRRRKSERHKDRFYEALRNG